MEMHVIFDARDIGSWWLAAAFPLLPLGMSLLGLGEWRTTLRAGREPLPHIKGFTLVTVLIFIVCTWACWWNVIRVEYQYLNNNVSTVEGRIAEYNVLDGKDVSFLVDGIPFNVSCCDLSPIYRGTPTDGLTRVLLHKGMWVRVTYLNTGEIVRIETHGSAS